MNRGSPPKGRKAAVLWPDIGGAQFWPELGHGRERSPSLPSLSGGASVANEVNPKANSSSRAAAAPATSDELEAAFQATQHSQMRAWESINAEWAEAQRLLSAPGDAAEREAKLEEAQEIEDEVAHAIEQLLLDEAHMARDVASHAASHVAALHAELKAARRAAEADIAMAMVAQEMERDEVQLLLALALDERDPAKRREHEERAWQMETSAREATEQVVASRRLMVEAKMLALEQAVREVLPRAGLLLDEGERQARVKAVLSSARKNSYAEPLVRAPAAEDEEGLDPDASSPLKERARSEGRDVLTSRIERARFSRVAMRAHADVAHLRKQVATLHLEAEASAKQQAQAHAQAALAKAQLESELLEMRKELAKLRAAEEAARSSEQRLANELESEVAAREQMRSDFTQLLLEKDEALSALRRELAETVEVKDEVLSTLRKELAETVQGKDEALSTLSREFAEVEQGKDEALSVLRREFAEAMEGKDETLNALRREFADAAEGKDEALSVLRREFAEAMEGKDEALSALRREFADAVEGKDKALSALRRELAEVVEQKDGALSALTKELAGVGAEKDVATSSIALELAAAEVECDSWRQQADDLKVLKDHLQDTLRVDDTASPPFLAQLRELKQEASTASVRLSQHERDAMGIISTFQAELREMEFAWTELEQVWMENVAPYLRSQKGGSRAESHLPFARTIEQVNAPQEHRKQQMQEWLSQVVRPAHSDDDSPMPCSSIEERIMRLQNGGEALSPTTLRRNQIFEIYGDSWASSQMSSMGDPQDGDDSILNNGGDASPFRGASRPASQSASSYTPDSRPYSSPGVRARSSMKNKVLRRTFSQGPFVHVRVPRRVLQLRSLSWHGCRPSDDWYDSSRSAS